jgi:hypothetical protein
MRRIRVVAAAILGSLLVLAGMTWCAAGVAAGVTNHRTVFGGDRPLGWWWDLDQSLLPGFGAMVVGVTVYVTLGGGIRRPSGPAPP